MMNRYIHINGGRLGDENAKSTQAPTAWKPLRSASGNGQEPRLISIDFRIYSRHAEATGVDIPEAPPAALTYSTNVKNPT